MKTWSLTLWALCACLSALPALAADGDLYNISGQWAQYICDGKAEADEASNCGPISVSRWGKDSVGRTEIRVTKDTDCTALDIDVYYGNSDVCTQGIFLFTITDDLDSAATSGISAWTTTDGRFVGPYVCAVITTATACTDLDVSMLVWGK